MKNNKISVLFILVLAMLFSSLTMAAKMKTSQVYNATYDQTWEALVWTAGIRRDVNISKEDKEAGTLNLANKGMGNGAGFSTIEIEIKAIDEDVIAIMFITEGKTWARNINASWTGQFLNDVNQRLKKIKKK